MNRKEAYERLIDGEKVEEDMFSSPDFIDDFYYYGEYLISCRQYKKAMTCFLKCFELDSTCAKAAFQLLHESLNTKNDKDIFIYYEALCQSEEYPKEEQLFHLYLLNFITDIPKQYQSQAGTLTLEDVTISSDKSIFPNPELYNKIRQFVFQQQFELALTYANELEPSILSKITKKLIWKAFQLDKKNKEKISNLITYKQYQDLVQKLDKGNLTKEEQYMKKLALKLLQLKNMHELPLVVEDIASNVFDAIDKENYILALTFIDEDCQKGDISFGMNCIRLLLIEIQKQMERLENAYQAKNHFITIVQCLKEGKVEDAIVLVHSYLSAIGKEAYAFFIDDLIKLSLLENDCYFQKPIAALFKMNQESFLFDVSNYVQNFFDMLEAYHLDKAGIYLDIIMKAEKKETFMIPVLKQAYEKAEKELNLEETTLEEALPVAEPVNKMDTQMLERIDKALTKIETEKLMILEPMDGKTREQVHQRLCREKNIISFTIKKEMEGRVVIRYCPREVIDKKNTLEAFYQSYQKRNYAAVIRYGHRLFPLHYISVDIYAKIGLSYLKCGQKQKAIDYLMVATSLDKKEIGGRYDFTDLIAEIEGNVSFEDRKPKIKMNETDFQDHLDKYFGIENMELILKMVNEQNLSIPEVCQILEIKEEMVPIVYLAYARFCYEQGNNQFGDKLVREAEKSKNKTAKVKSLLIEVKKNKLFYKYREIGNHPYVLTLPNQRLGE